jgi:excisionase family DNA binding protein
MGEGIHLRVYTVEQVAETLQIGRDKVYMLLRTGRLRSVKIDRLRRITHRQLADYITALESMQ